jgi:hypothetical protein
MMSLLMNECCCVICVCYFCEVLQVLVFFRYENIETSRQKIRVNDEWMEQLPLANEQPTMKTFDDEKDTKVPLANEQPTMKTFDDEKDTKEESDETAEHSKEEKGLNKNMSVLFKVFTLEQRDVLEKHVLPKLWKRERAMLRQVNRESRVAMQTLLSAKDYQILAFSLDHVPRYINTIIQETRDLEMVRYAHEHLHYQFSKGTANSAATTGEIGILKYVVDNGAPVSVYTLRILNTRFDAKMEGIRLLRENVFIRDRHSCTYCGRRYASDNLTIDHIVPKSKGGKREWANVTTACATCNKRKGNELLKNTEEIRTALKYLSIKCNGSWG